MFKITSDCEVRLLKMNRDLHGDEPVRAIDVKVMAIGADVEGLTSAIPDLGRKFYNNDEPLLGEIFPLRVRHKIENVRVNLGGVELKGADVNKIQITPQPGRVANVLFNIHADDFTDAKLAKLSKIYIDKETKIEVEELQAHIEDMEQ